MHDIHIKPKFYKLKRLEEFSQLIIYMNPSTNGK